MGLNKKLAIARMYESAEPAPASVRKPSVGWRVTSRRRSKDRAKRLKDENRRLPAGVERLTFGKHAGKSFDEIAEVDPGYLRWLADQEWFRRLGPRDATNIIVRARHRVADGKIIVDPDLIPPWEGESVFAEDQ